MESDAEQRPSGESPADELAAVRRALIRPHVDYPDPPWWTWFASGLTASGYAASFALEQPWPGTLLMSVSLAGSFGLIWFITRQRGNFPDITSMPRELRREALATWLRIGLLAVAVIACWHAVSVPVAIVFAGVGHAAVLFAHQRRHDSIAARLRADIHPRTDS
ncbi:MAG: hypothetical protein AAGG08_00785 [Actinomycetota bacterium]